MQKQSFRAIRKNLFRMATP